MLVNEIYRNLISDINEFRKRLNESLTEKEFSQLYADLSQERLKIAEAKTMNLINSQDAFLLEGNINDLELLIPDQYKPNQTKNHHCAIS